MGLFGIDLGRVVKAVGKTATAVSDVADLAGAVVNPTDTATGMDLQHASLNKMKTVAVVTGSTDQKTPNARGSGASGAEAWATEMRVASDVAKPGFDEMMRQVGAGVLSDGFTPGPDLMRRVQTSLGATDSGVRYMDAIHERAKAHPLYGPPAHEAVVKSQFGGPANASRVREAIKAAEDLDIKERIGFGEFTPIPGTSQDFWVMPSTSSISWSSFTGSGVTAGVETIFNTATVALHKLADCIVSPPAGADPNVLAKSSVYDWYVRLQVSGVNLPQNVRIVVSPAPYAAGGIDYVSYPVSTEGAEKFSDTREMRIDGPFKFGLFADVTAVTANVNHTTTLAVDAVVFGRRKANVNPSSALTYHHHDDAFNVFRYASISDSMFKFIGVLANNRLDTDPHFNVLRMLESKLKRIRDPFATACQMVIGTYQRLDQVEVVTAFLKDVTDDNVEAKLASLCDVVQWFRWDGPFGGDHADGQSRAIGWLEFVRHMVPLAAYSGAGQAVVRDT